MSYPQETQRTSRHRHALVASAALAALLAFSCGGAEPTSDAEAEDSNPSRASTPAAATTPAPGAGAQPTFAPAAAVRPTRGGQPWEYDAASDHHYDPRHGHWHQGPPPADASRAYPPQRVGEAWEWDEPTNHYWDPNHSHWHEGNPPAPELRGTTSPPHAPHAPTGQPATGVPATAGQPWEYDAATNRHFDPGHGHWHPGPAPPESQRR